jgi:1-phosphofructokinase
LKVDESDQASLMKAMSELIAAGARSVVLSRQGKPALARMGDDWFEARVPELHPADHRGAGDSMTAGLATALRRDLTPEDALRLACAAGAANVTRHGLGSADTDLIPGLTAKVEVEKMHR